MTVLPNGKRLKASVESLEREWARLCEQYLPVADAGTIWRMSRRTTKSDPTQGWKLHVSATILSANKILARIAPCLSASGVLFKAPRTLEELVKLNCGLHYGFSQVGKFVTVYPRSADEAVSLARTLHRLTCRRPAPPVPYDRRFRPSSPVFYRYGAFDSLQIENADGTTTPAIYNQEGALVPDRREPGAAVPDWLTDPFPHPRRSILAPVQIDNPLATTIRAYEALSQRGKGGVYRALDLSVIPARVCSLKEGRKHGETSWDGTDGYEYLRHEEQVLVSLAAAGVPVPALYTSFRTRSNYYLVTEALDGTNLHTLLRNGRKKLALATALQYAGQIVELLDKIHAAGWVWRDCKPLNMIVSREGMIRPLDFEGACRIDEPDPLPWGTPGYISPERLTAGSQIPEDLYALGATLYHILSGRLPESSSRITPLGRLRHSLPPGLSQIVSALLAPNPAARPDLRRVAGIISDIASRI
jgi:class IV lanthipeptide synthase